MDMERTRTRTYYDDFDGALTVKVHVFPNSRCSLCAFRQIAVYCLEVGGCSASTFQPSGYTTIEWFGDGGKDLFLIFGRSCVFAKL